MDLIILWFILTNGSGYLSPLEVRSTDSIIQCNVSGAIVGVQVNKLENPTKALWPDPHNIDAHCEIDISTKVATLINGEYHLATTIVGNGSFTDVYISHDPHTSVYWIKSNDPISIPLPINLKITGQ